MDQENSIIMVVQSTRRVSSTRKREKKATRHSSTRPTHIFFLFNLLVLALEYSNEWKKVSSTRPSTVFFSTFFHSFEYSSARTSKLKRKKKRVGRVLECRVAFFSRLRVLDTLRVLCTTMYHGTGGEKTRISKNTPRTRINTNEYVF